MDATHHTMDFNGRIDDDSTHRPLSKVVIVGCGLGGLSCAIACLREGLIVEILEKEHEVGEVGAGIAATANASRVLAHYGLMEKFREAGALKLEHQVMLRYTDGKVITSRPNLLPWMEGGHSTYSAHRADFHRVLLEEASKLGAKLRFGCAVKRVNFETPSVILDDGEEISGDVVIGADGFRSVMRDQLHGRHLPPFETGDQAYRATISRSSLESLHDPTMEPLLNQSSNFLWMGPQKHAVFYPIRHQKEFNLVLLRPDDLPQEVYRSSGDIQEMRDTFKGWDSRLTAILSCVQAVAKWKLCQLEELDSWVKGSVALLGDSCHPTLPYQAQGAAMALEDGAALGTLLGLLSQTPRLTPSERRSHIPAILRLYEEARKQRTTTNVQGAVEARLFYHLDDGPESEARNEEVKDIDWSDPHGKCKWLWGDMGYLKELLDFDTIADARERFHVWIDQRKSEVILSYLGTKPNAASTVTVDDLSILGSRGCYVH